MNDKSQSTKQRKTFTVHAGRLTAPSGLQVDVSVDPVVIGREAGCRLVLADPEVSAVHCEVRAEPEGVRVRDLDSTNGTFLGPARVREVYLTGPCTLTLGSSAVRFEPTIRTHVEIARDDHFGDLVGGSVRMRHLFHLLGRFAPANVSALITGETGTGKELVAEAMHENSLRRGKPFVVVDCTAIVPSLAESLLFGHKRGSFTHATEDRPGPFEKANGGTLFLDEIGELPIDLQPKLLRVLAEGRVQRLGESTYRPVDVRVIAATNRNILPQINPGCFRADLYYRLAQISLSLPPLRERREDIPAIVRARCTREGKPERADEILELVKDWLASYGWPGNVRELTQFVKTIVEFPPRSVSFDPLHPDYVPLDILLPMAAGRELAAPGTPFSAAKRAAITAFELRYFRDLIEATSGNISEIARRSGLERHHVRWHLRRLGLKGTPSEG